MTRNHPRTHRIPHTIGLPVGMVAMALVAACGADAAGDEPCPDGTWRSGSGCIDNGLDTGPDAPADAAGDASDGADTDIDTTPSQDAADTTIPDADDATEDTAPDAADAADDVAEDGGPSAPTGLPFAVDDYWVPSGFMGDGERPGGITVEDDACDGDRAGGGAGICRTFTWTKGSSGWGGVFWQYPDGNWGDAPGLAVPEGATEVAFYAWGETGEEVINFLVGIGDADGFAAESGGIALTTEPTPYVISLDGLAVGDEVVGAFGWVTDSGEAATFTVDDVQWR